MSNEVITLADARRRLGTFANRIRAGDHIEITDHGYPFAVLIPIADYRKLRTDTANADPIGEPR